MTKAKKETEKETSILDLSKLQINKLTTKHCAAIAQMVYEFCELSGINPDEFLSDKEKEGKTQQQVVTDVLVKITKLVGIVTKDFDFKNKAWGPLATKFYECISYVTEIPFETLTGDDVPMSELEDLLFVLFGKFQELKVTGFFTRLRMIWQDLITLLNSIEKEIEPARKINPVI
jgi:hypothetical protein